jgi:hypothetical protein
MWAFVSLLGKNTKTARLDSLADGSAIALRCSIGALRHLKTNAAQRKE